MIEGERVLDERELLDLFEPDEGAVNMYYGRIGNGKTYAATADILDLLKRGQVVYCNWHIEWNGYDQRQSFAWSIMNLIFFRKRFYYFPKENLHYFSPDDVTIEWLSTLNDCNIFIDEGQWIFDSYEGTRFSKEKRRLILHTRHLNRSLNIISQRTQAIQVTARGQVNRFYKCEKRLTWPWLIFARYEYQDMNGEDVDETEPQSTKVYFAKSEVLNAYDTQYLRNGVERSQEVWFEAYDLGFWARVSNVIHKFTRARRLMPTARDTVMRHLPIVWDSQTIELVPETLGVKSEVASINSGERLNTVSTGTGYIPELLRLREQIKKNMTVS